MTAQPALATELESARIAAALLQGYDGRFVVDEATAGAEWSTRLEVCGDSPLALVSTTARRAVPLEGRAAVAEYVARAAWRTPRAAVEMS